MQQRLQQPTQPVPAWQLYFGLPAELTSPVGSFAAAAAAAITVQHRPGSQAVSGWYRWGSDSSSLVDGSWGDDVPHEAAAGAGGSDMYATEVLDPHDDVRDAAAAAPGQQGQPEPVSTAGSSWPEQQRGQEADEGAVVGDGEQPPPAHELDLLSSDEQHLLPAVDGQAAALKTEGHLPGCSG